MQQIYKFVENFFFLKNLDKNLHFIIKSLLLHVLIKKKKTSLFSLSVDVIRLRIVCE